jgi:hypothetical protein
MCWPNAHLELLGDEEVALLELGLNRTSEDDQDLSEERILISKMRD